RRKASGRGAGQVSRATRLEYVDGFGARGAQFVERRTLRVGWLHHRGDALERPIRQLRGIIAANLRCASLAMVRPRGIAAGARAAAAALRADAVADRLPVSRAVAACGIDARPATRLPATERVAMRAPPTCAVPMRAVPTCLAPICAAAPKERAPPPPRAAKP